MTMNHVTISLLTATVFLVGCGSMEDAALYAETEGGELVAADGSATQEAALLSEPEQEESWAAAPADEDGPVTSEAVGEAICPNNATYRFAYCKDWRTAVVGCKQRNNGSLLWQQELFCLSCIDQNRWGNVACVVGGGRPSVTVGGAVSDAPPPAEDEAIYENQ